MFCYEAGPTGYGLYRLIKSLGHVCLVRHHSLACSDGIKRLFSWEFRVHDWRDYAIHMIFVAQ